MNQCKECKKSGQVQCWTCSGSGAVACDDCAGSGHQSTWFAFDDGDRWEVAVPQDPVVFAHRFLAQARPVDRAELSAFTVNHLEESQGPLTVAQLTSNRAMVDQELAKIDSRCERVLRQQYLQIAVLQRDVAYAMCGTTGVLSLTGNLLTPASTTQALRPVRRRLWFTGFATLVVAATLIGLFTALSGQAAYFSSTNQTVGVAFVGSALFALPWLMGALRSWRTGLGWSGTRIPEKISGGLALAAVGFGIAVLLVSKPSLAEAESALAAKDSTEARAVLVALQETEGATPDVLALEDRIHLAEASVASGDAKLALLDRVAKANRAKAGEAAALARTERLQRIRAALTEKRPDRALASLDEWFPKTTDPEIMEERGRAHDQRLAACPTVPCKWAAASEAVAGHPTDARGALLTKLRADLDAALLPPVADKDPLTRMRQAKTLEEVASETLKLTTTTPEIIAKAQEGQTWVAAERAKVPLIGSNLDVIAAVLGSAERKDATSAKASLLGGLEAYFALDARGNCNGIYVVGSSEHHHLFVSAEWPASRIVAQAVGRPIKTLVSSPKNGDTLRWFEGSTPVVARFDTGNLIELRIGQATP